MKDNGLLSYIEETRPIIHCITNVVTANDCANALLAFGASPTMAHHEAEVAEITAGCSALVCNLGATESFAAMETACRVSGELQHPIVLDPVGAGGSAFRRDFAMKLLATGQITCIRGNSSEIAALCYNEATQTGVDAAKQSLKDKADCQIAEELAARYNTIVIISGEKDIVSDGTATYEVMNGSPMMTRITGAGCMESAVLAAFLWAARSQGKKEVKAAAKLMTIMGICGELAEDAMRKAAGGTMTFYQCFLDNMSKLNQNVIAKRKTMKKLK